ncbi:MAG TPA: DUF4129 domain-containing protein [Ktedonobacterales bacterium]|nr:DUF4129 domain-containing protein [Ktedonobacterales bacterium]
MQQQTSESATRTTAAASRQTRQRWLSPERASAAVSIAFLTLLETLPIEAALLTYTATSSESLDQAFGPFWLIVGMLLLFALARWRIGARHPTWTVCAALLIGVLTAALFVALSPTAYGSVPGGVFSSNWINQLITDATLDAPRFNGLFVIAPVVAYLGWRGLVLGGSLPKIETTLRRFMISLAVVVVACICGLAAPANLQATLQGALLTLLALDAFAGLAAAALSRRSDEQTSAQVEARSETTRWLLTALGSAALVIAVAFFIGLALNFRLLSALVGALGPVGAVIYNIVTWLVSGLAYIIWNIFFFLFGWFFKLHGSPIPQPTAPPATFHGKPFHPATSIPGPFLIVAGVVFGLIVVVALVVAINAAVRALLRTLNAGDKPEEDEEREALDARGLLRRQARDLLNALRRRRATEHDPLRAGGARWLYREALRAGTAAGIARQPGETADEYSHRLDAALRERASTSDVARLTTLTRAYDDARYGADDERQAKASPDVVAASRWVTAALRKLQS